MAQERLRIVEWNVENLFDTEHDSEKKRIWSLHPTRHAIGHAQSIGRS